MLDNISSETYNSRSAGSRFSLTMRLSFASSLLFACVDSGIVFKIKFLSSSAVLGLRKALGQDAMSSSVSRRNVQNPCEISFSCINFIPNVFRVC